MKACNFPGARRIGSPTDWDQNLDGSCGVTFVTDAVDTLSGMNIMYSVYPPTSADLEAMNAGGAIRLGIMGRSHPVFQLAVLTPQVCERADLKPMWDLGEPI